MTRITVKVTPKAAANKVVVDSNPDGTVLYRVYVTVTPEEGKANEAVLKLLAKHLKIRKSALTIVQGLKSRNKLIKLQ